MNLEGTLIMIISISLVTGLAAFCVLKIMQGHGK
jgi:hypothetical protein